MAGRIYHADSNGRSDCGRRKTAKPPRQFTNYDGAKGDIKDDFNWASNVGAEWFPLDSTPERARSRAVAR